MVIEEKLNEKAFTASSSKKVREFKNHTIQTKLSCDLIYIEKKNKQYYL